MPIDSEPQIVLRRWTSIHLAMVFQCLPAQLADHHVSQVVKKRDPRSSHAVAFATSHAAPPHPCRYERQPICYLHGGSVLARLSSAHHDLTCWHGDPHVDRLTG